MFWSCCQRCSVQQLSVYEYSSSSGEQGILGHLCQWFHGNVEDGGHIRRPASRHKGHAISRWGGLNETDTHSSLFNLLLRESWCGLSVHHYGCVFWDTGDSYRVQSSSTGPPVEVFSMSSVISVSSSPCLTWISGALFSIRDLASIPILQRVWVCLVFPIRHYKFHEAIGQTSIANKSNSPSVDVFLAELVDPVSGVGVDDNPLAGFLEMVNRTSSGVCCPGQPCWGSFWRWWSWSPGVLPGAGPSLQVLAGLSLAVWWRSGRSPPGPRHRAGLAECGHWGSDGPGKRSYQKMLRSHRDLLYITTCHIILQETGSIARQVRPSESESSMIGEPTYS